MSSYEALDESEGGGGHKRMSSSSSGVGVGAGIASGIGLPTFGSNKSAGVSASLSEPLATSPHHLSNSDDPYYVFRNDLYRKLESVDEALKEYLRIVYETDTSVNVYDLKDSKKALKRHIKNAECTLRDVQMTVSLVESDRDKFSGTIDNSELCERKALVKSTEQRLHHAREAIHSDEVKAKFLQDERAKAARRMGNNAAPPTSSTTSTSNNSSSPKNSKNTGGALSSLAASTTTHSKRNNGSGSSMSRSTSATSSLHDDIESNNNDFIIDSQAKTSLLFRQQDECLDDLEVAVTRVGEIAGNIHDEVTEQNKMLTEMDADLEDAEEQLGMVMGKLAKVLKTKNKCQLCTIVALSATTIVLFFALIYF